MEVEIFFFFFSTLQHIDVVVLVTRSGDTPGSGKFLELDCGIRYGTNNSTYGVRSRARQKQNQGLGQGIKGFSGNENNPSVSRRGNAAFSHTAS